MTATTMTIPKRPFSVEPITHVMLPDGIFDTAIFIQEITCHYVNVGAAPLRNVSIYLEGVGDPGISPFSKTYDFEEIPPGGSVLVSWRANFQHATPGKTNVSFIAQADGHVLNRTIKRIFVSHTTYDAASRTFICTVPEGTMRVSLARAIGPCPDDWSRECDREGKRWPPVGPWIPAAMAMEVSPNPPYAGTFGDIPFQDPWWKILAWVVAALAAIGAIIAAATGGGTASTGVSGTFDETTGEVHCCTPDPTAGPDGGGATVAGVLSTVATVAAAVGMSDVADPWRRGEEATPPPAGVITLRERVHADMRVPHPPNAGEPFEVEIKWTYTRETTAGNLSHQVKEVVQNEHLVKAKQIEVPDKIHGLHEPLWVKARFVRPDGKPYVGDQLYVYALLLSPGGLGFVIHLEDGGVRPDIEASDGTYTGQLELWRIYQEFLKKPEALLGYWRVYVFAQDVNDATPDMAPTDAATHLGGFVVASATQLTYDPSLPCPLSSDGAVLVVP